MKNQFQNIYFKYTPAPSPGDLMLTTLSALGKCIDFAGILLDFAPCIKKRVQLPVDAHIIHDIKNAFSIIMLMQF